MYIVKATNHIGPMNFACGTSHQALDKAEELAGRGFKDVLIKDPKGKEWTLAAFEASIGTT